MEHSSYDYHTVGKFYTFISILSAFISVSEVLEWMKIIGSVIAIISGIMAIRYYHFATKKIKKND